MEVEFTFDGFAVTVWVPEVDIDEWDDDEIIAFARDRFGVSKAVFINDADSARVL